MQRSGDSDRCIVVTSHRQVQPKCPEDRETRLGALKSDIEIGHYSVVPEQVAERIMKNLLFVLLDY
jgi:anti-sigma28 factor (negative regulator of flagellin synthesis)